jgi:hypothetical protein
MSDAEARIRECLMASVPELAAKLAVLHVTTPQTALPAWMADLDSGELLTTSSAAKICDVTDEAVRQRCQEMEELGTPIGRCVGKIWLVSRRLLLDDLALRKGEHGRLAAASRAEKMPKLGLAQAIRLSK